MKTSLDFLPLKKQQELQQITDIILQAVSPEKIILFGSYARGKWTEDRHMEGHILHEYVSDYDILVIMPAGVERDEHELEEMVETRCNFKAPVTVIVHSIDFVNARLGEKHYFFSDIKKEGVLLYDAGNVELAEPRELTNEEKKQIASEDYEYWFGSAQDFMENANFSYGRKKYKNAAFQLHQATEHAYHAIELVFTGYKPRTHNLGKLYRMTKSFSPELPPIFPQNNKKEKHLFTQLKKAYIEARYKKTYNISEGEVTVLVERVKKLHGVAERICREKLESF